MGFFRILVPIPTYEYELGILELVEKRHPSRAAFFIPNLTVLHRSGLATTFFIGLGARAGGFGAVGVGAVGVGLGRATSMLGGDRRGRGGGWARARAAIHIDDNLGDWGPGDGGFGGRRASRGGHRQRGVRIGQNRDKVGRGRRVGHL